MASRGTRGDNRSERLNCEVQIVIGAYARTHPKQDRYKSWVLRCLGRAAGSQFKYQEGGDGRGVDEGIDGWSEAYVSQSQVEISGIEECASHLESDESDREEPLANASSRQMLASRRFINPAESSSCISIENVPELHLQQQSSPRIAQTEDNIILGLRHIKSQPSVANINLIAQSSGHQEEAKEKRCKAVLA